MGAVRGGSSRQAIAARPAHVVLARRLGSRDADLLPGDRARRPAGCYRALPGLEPGHSVILPQLLGWTGVVAAQSASESYFLAFLVGLHVATALALLAFYRSTWARIVRGLVASMRTRRIETPDHRLAWLLVVATIPAGLVGLLLEHTLRVGAASPKLGRARRKRWFDSTWR